jgi:hypothetical protein
MGLFGPQQVQDEGVKMKKINDHGNPEEQEDTNYRPINWRRILLTPKYLRMSWPNEYTCFAGD